MAVITSLPVSFPQTGSSLWSENKMSTPSKGFNINLSRISPRVEQNSMLAYSEKLKNFREARERRQYANLGDALQVKARHIPKIGQNVPRLIQKKPVTLKHISSKRSRSLDGDNRHRSVSPSMSLPGHISRTSRDTVPGLTPRDLLIPRIESRDSMVSGSSPRDTIVSGINIASASEEKDIVGYKIKKPNKFVDQSTMTESSSKTKVVDYLRSSVLPPIKTDDFKKQVYKYSPRHGHITRIRRPNRARRMELRGSFLNDIPEGDSSRSPSLVTESGDSTTQTLSSVRLLSRNSLDNQDRAMLMGSIDLHIPNASLTDKLGVELVNPSEITLNFKKSPRISPRVSPQEQYESNARKIDPNKTRSQGKKVKRLIFLNERADNVSFDE